MNNTFWYGCVESRDDPLELGRCQVRIVGLHTEDKIKLPTADLPWAHPMQPIISAAMNGIGYTPVGPVPGTWVVIIFRDIDQQEPIMIGSIGGIPQSKEAQAVNDADTDIIVNDGGILSDTKTGYDLRTATGISIQVGSSESKYAASNSNIPHSVDEYAKPEVNIFTTPISTTPPPNSTNNTVNAQFNMQYILWACNLVGITSKYAQAAILAIVGGECSWVASEEEYIYRDAKTLSDLFHATFKGNINSARVYIKWNGTKEGFFNKVYEPTGNGKSVGNINPDDGGKYYGRGFIKTTGRSGYKRLQKELTKYGYTRDLINSPNLVLTDISVSSLACAIFYKINVTHDQNDQGYFDAALRVTGTNLNDSYTKKKVYYDYFMGTAPKVTSTDKLRTDSIKKYTQAEINAASLEKRGSLSEDRTSNKTIGFCDPNGKYPLRNLMNEPDTHRLARGVIKDTSISFKDASRTVQIPAANNGNSWSQPMAPYGGKYPYTKIIESESGHIQTIDDTPGNETVSTYHRKGTFTEIDANGTQVNKVVGDGYFIIDRNGAIFIGGTANITFGNSVNIMCMGSADIEVNGVSTINLNNDADIGVAGNLNLAVGGDMNVKVDGAYSLTAAGIKEYSTETIKIQADKDITTKSFKDIITVSNEIISSKSKTTILEITETFSIKSKDSAIESTGTVSMKSGGDMLSEAGGDQNIQAHGDVLIDSIPLRPDYPEAVGYSIASGANSAPVTKVLPIIQPLTLISPEREVPVNTISDAIPTPDREYYGVGLYESPAEYATVDGAIDLQATSAKTPPGIKNNAAYKGYINEWVAPGSASNKVTKTPIMISDIRILKEYPLDYKISAHFTLAHVGGANLQSSKLLSANRFRQNKTLTSSDIVENLAYLAENILEPIYDLYGPTGGSSLGGAQDQNGVWQINNALRFGNGVSEHNEGCAIDIQPVSLGAVPCYNMAKRICPLLKFNQLILEFRTPTFIHKGQTIPTGNWWRWIHISYRKGGNINEYATMVNDGYTSTGIYWSGYIVNYGDAVGHPTIV